MILHVSVVLVFQGWNLRLYHLLTGGYIFNSRARGHLPQVSHRPTNDIVPFQTDYTFSLSPYIMTHRLSRLRLDTGNHYDDHQLK
jgi:hypothetical protein